MPKIRKSTSNRITARKKYSVLKKVREHHRKIAKVSKKLKKEGLTPKRVRKTTGIPNLAPFKEEMLDAMERRESMIDQAKALRVAQKTLPRGTLENYAASVKAKVEKYEEEKKMGGLTEKEISEATNLMAQAGEIDDPNLRQMGQSRRAYVKELKKVLENSDVIIEVLDARDPEGCRNKELELQAQS